MKSPSTILDVSALTEVGKLSWTRNPESGNNCFLHKLSFLDKIAEANEKMGGRSDIILTGSNPATLLLTLPQSHFDGNSLCVLELPTQDGFLKLPVDSHSGLSKWECILVKDQRFVRIVIE